MSKKYLPFLIIFAVLPIFVLFFVPKILAQFPSFELYKSGGCFSNGGTGSSCPCGSSATCACPPGTNCTPFPEVENVSTYKSSATRMVIVADIFDVSGVAGAVANIEDPNNPGQYMNVEYSTYGDGVMSCIADCDSYGNGTWQTTIDISDNTVWDPNFNYQIDISAQDKLINKSNICDNTINPSIPVSFSCNSTHTCPCYYQVGNFTISNASPAELVFIAPSSGTQLKVGSPAVFSVTLKHTAGPPIDDAEITFQDVVSGTIIGSANTGVDGIATISYIIPLDFSESTFSLLANYAGESDIIMPATNTATWSTVSCGLLAVSDNSAICIEVDPISIAPTTSGQSMSFTVNGSTTPSGIVTGQTAALLATITPNVSGQTITFMDGSTTLQTTTTNSSGQASFSYMPSSGTRALEAVFGGDPLRGINAAVKQVSLTVTGNCATSSNATVCINVPTPPTTISTYTAPTTSGQSMSFTVNGSTTPSGIVTGTLADLSATLSPAVPNKPITFMDGTVLLKTVYTNSSGTATYPYYPSSGTRALEAVFGGDPLRGINAAVKQVSLTVTGNCATSSNATVCINLPVTPTQSASSSFLIQP
jgi:hypothetical protein